MQTTAVHPRIVTQTDHQVHIWSFHAATGKYTSEQTIDAAGSFHSLTDSSFSLEREPNVFDIWRIDPAQDAFVKARTWDHVLGMEALNPDHVCIETCAHEFQVQSLRHERAKHVFHNDENDNKGEHTHIRAVWPLGGTTECVMVRVVESGAFVVEIWTRLPHKRCAYRCIQSIAVTGRDCPTLVSLVDGIAFALTVAVRHTFKTVIYRRPHGASEYQAWQVLCDSPDGSNSCSIDLFPVNVHCFLAEYTSRNDERRWALYHWRHHSHHHAPDAHLSTSNTGSHVHSLAHYECTWQMNDPRKHCDGNLLASASLLAIYEQGAASPAVSLYAMDEGMAGHQRHIQLPESWAAAKIMAALNDTELVIQDVSLRKVARRQWSAKTYIARLLALDDPSSTTRLTDLQSIMGIFRCTAACTRVDRQIVCANLLQCLNRHMAKDTAMMVADYVI